MALTSYDGETPDTGYSVPSDRAFIRRLTECDFCHHDYPDFPKRTVDGFFGCEYCVSKCDMCCDRRSNEQIFTYQREKHCEECLRASIAEDERAEPTPFDMSNYLDARAWLKNQEDERESGSGTGGSRMGAAVTPKAVVPAKLLHSGADRQREATAPAFSGVSA